LAVRWAEERAPNQPAHRKRTCARRGRHQNNSTVTQAQSISHRRASYALEHCRSAQATQAQGTRQQTKRKEGQSVATTEVESSTNSSEGRSVLPTHSGLGRYRHSLARHQCQPQPPAAAPLPHASVAQPAAKLAPEKNAGHQGPPDGNPQSHRSRTPHKVRRSPRQAQPTTGQAATKRTPPQGPSTGLAISRYTGSRAGTATQSHSSCCAATAGIETALPLPAVLPPNVPLPRRSPDHARDVTPASQ
jgi:hypothetical protein